MPAPNFVPPQLCTLVEAPPSTSGWVHEVKFDGYRMQLRVIGGEPTVRTRGGLDWTAKFPATAKAAAALADCILDGELTALRDDGSSDFPALLEAISAKRDYGLVYCAFDCLWAKGDDLRSLPLLDRKKRLAALTKRGGGAIRYVDHLASGGPAVLEAACRSSLEGVVSKKADAPYRSGRTTTWLKSKCRPGQEVVIVGWTEEGPRFRSLLVGVYEGKRLVSAGKVGTGFSNKVADALLAKLKPLEIDKPPLDDPPTSSARRRWVKPQLVAEITFAGWTGDGQVRQASFRALRADKKPTAVRREG